MADGGDLVLRQRGRADVAVGGHAEEHLVRPARRTSAAVPPQKVFDVVRMGADKQTRSFANDLLVLPKPPIEIEPDHGHDAAPQFQLLIPRAAHALVIGPQKLRTPDVGGNLARNRAGRSSRRQRQCRS